MKKRAEKDNEWPTICKPSSADVLFSDQSAEGAQQDLVSIYGLLTGFCAQYPDTSFDIDHNGIHGVVFGMRQDFPYPGGLLGASPFKKAANFVCHWIAAAPLTASPAPTENLNAAFALIVACRSLRGAELFGDDEAPPRKLTKAVELSDHSFWDIADALSSATPVEAFKLVTVLLEQMAYKTNQECQYPTRPIG